MLKEAFFQSHPALRGTVESVSWLLPSGWLLLPPQEIGLCIMTFSSADFAGANSVDLLHPRVRLPRARYLSWLCGIPSGDTHQSPMWIKALEDG